MYTFDYIRAGSIDDAANVREINPDARYLAGGQTLIPTMKQRLAAPVTLVSLTGIAEMQGVKMGDGGLHVGAATTHAIVARDAAAHYPALAKLASGIGDPAVRNRGTIGGSIANNDPAACYPSAVLGSGATVVTNKRRIAADDYFQGLFTTALDEGEFVTSVIFPVPQQAAYVKFNQPASRFALTGVFVSRYAGGVRVAVTGAGSDGVFRWAEAERALSADFSAAALSGLSASASGMSSDLHGSAAYRANLVKVLAQRAVSAA